MLEMWLEVVQKDIAQWFLKMTTYADELLDELDEIQFPENVKAMQRNWIGRSQEPISISK